MFSFLKKFFGKSNTNPEEIIKPDNFLISNKNEKKYIIDINDEIKNFGLMHVAERIYSELEPLLKDKNIVKKYILEEIDAASNGDEEPKQFVRNCGFDYSEYHGQMSKEDPNINQDAVEAISNYMRLQTYKILDKKMIVKISLIIIDKIMKNWELGKYSKVKEDDVNSNIINVNAKAYYDLIKNKAEQGVVEAQFNLGVMFDKGDVVPQDYTKARFWFEKAAEQGYATAQYNLGLMFYNGKGVRQDLQIAKEWFGKACDAGFQLGCDEYKKLNERGI